MKSEISVKHRFADLDGLRVFYREAGPKDAPVVLLPHGYPCSSYEFRNFMPVAFFCGEAEFAPILPRDRPLVDPKRVYQVGIRSVDAREREEIAEHGVNVFDMRTIDEMGMAAIIIPQPPPSALVKNPPGNAS